MIRKCILSIPEVESILKERVVNNLDAKKHNKKGRDGYDSIRETEIAGEKIFTFSDRYKVFFTKGYKCVKCGIEGSYFALEKNIPEDGRYHLNLYALDKDGNEVLMTKDHIIPHSKGGKSTLENYQTMCTICNCKKGSNING